MHTDVAHLFLSMFRLTVLGQTAPYETLIRFYTPNANSKFIAYYSYELYIFEVSDIV